MTIVQRYLAKELSISMIAVTTVLLCVMTGTVFADTLRDVANGKFPPGLLLKMLGLSTLEALVLVAPLALFIAVLLAFGRLYRDQEMTVLQGFGVRLHQLLRPIAALALPVAVLVGLLSVSAAPWAQRVAQDLRAEALRNLSVTDLRPGRFHPLAGTGGVVFVGGQAEDGSLTDVFVHRDNAHRRDVTTAATAQQLDDPATGDRVLVLEDGFRADGTPGLPDYRWMRFARNEILLPGPEQDDTEQQLRALPLSTLLQTPGDDARIELEWRLAPAISVLVLALLAVPLARTAPRQRRMGRTVLGLFLYLIYANVLGVGRLLLERGDLPLVLGLWWLHGLVLGLALLMVWRQQRRLI